MGDQVFLSSKNLNVSVSRKLKKHWLGPFRVLQKIGSNAYRLELGERMAHIHHVFHVSLLKPYHAGGSLEGPPDPVVRESEV